MLHKALARTHGQSLPLVVLMLAAIFLIIGLGIDGGLLYVQRRLMQNTADAACIAAANELAIGRTNVQASTAAVSVITQNLGPDASGKRVNAPGTLSYANITDVYTPTIGAGAGLTRGLEVGVDAAGASPGPQVRVALTSPAYTYFMRVFGQSQYEVTGRARCDATAGGGGTPFAVSRWRRYKSNNTLSNQGLTTEQSIPGQLSGGDFVRDVLGQYNSNAALDASRVSNWPGWGTASYPGDPDLRTGLFGQPSTPATAATPGITTTIAGNGAEANLNGGGMRGAVLLDMRDMSRPDPKLYGGLDTSTSAASYKDWITRYIVEGYDGPFVPIGTQVAYIPGVSAGQVVKPFNLSYTTGQTVTTLIYNGTIYEDVNFFTYNQSGYPTALSKAARTNFTGTYPDDCDIAAHANQYIYDGAVMTTTLSPLAQYGMQVDPDPNRYLTMRMSAFSSVNGDLWNQLQAQFRDSTTVGNWVGFDSDGLPMDSVPFGIAASSTNLNVKLQQAETGTCSYEKVDTSSGTPVTTTVTVDMPVKPKEGAVTILLEAKDTISLQRRGRYVLANLGVADPNQDFYAYLSGNLTFPQIELDTNGVKEETAPLAIHTVAGTSLTLSQVGIGFDWFTGDLTYIGNTEPLGIDVAVVNNASPTLRVRVASNAATGKDYYLRTSVTYNGKTQWVWYYFAVKPPMGNSASVDQYVFTLGYAEFVITGTDGSNYIDARAISGLLAPTEVRRGMQPRLIQWQD